MTRNPFASAINAADLANRSSMGVSANPSSGTVRGAGGASESTGSPSPALIASLLMGGAKGGAMGKGSRGPRSPERPSLARANAASRRLNGNASGSKISNGL